jgi:type IV pilus assembly protein PilX
MTMNAIMARRPAKLAQRGAALVVGLLLLLVLTLLAISGMNTSTLELVMAGNTQFYQNAFQASETGIERVS